MSISWWVDGTVPEDKLLSAALPVGVDVAEFKTWLRPHLERYRNATTERSLLPQTANERAHVKRLRKAVVETREALRTLTPEANASLVTWALKAEEPDLPKRLAHDLMILEVLLSKVALALSSRPRKWGRKSEIHRDTLLNAVVDKLKAHGVKPGSAHSVAGSILTLCGVTPPGEVKSSGRAAKRAQ